MKNPAREKFLPLLSPYVDGELSPEERQLVEQHLSNNKDSAGQVADFRAGDALIRHAFETQADQVDWKAFGDEVMARVTPERLPLLQRLSLALSELFTYQRGPMVAGLAGAAAAVAVAVPAALSMATPDGYGGQSLRVQQVSIVEQGAQVKPVVVEADGDAVIWVLDAQGSPDGGKKKRDDDTSEETLTEPAPNQGEL